MCYSVAIGADWLTPTAPLAYLHPQPKAEAMAHPAVPLALDPNVIAAEQYAYREWLRTKLDARWGQLQTIAELMGGFSPI